MAYRICSRDLTVWSRIDRNTSGSEHATLWSHRIVQYKDTPTRPLPVRPFITLHIADPCIAARSTHLPQLLPRTRILPQPLPRVSHLAWKERPRTARSHPLIDQLEVSTDVSRQHAFPSFFVLSCSPMSVFLCSVLPRPGHPKTRPRILPSRRTAAGSLLFLSFPLISFSTAGTCGSTFPRRPHDMLSRPPSFSPDIFDVGRKVRTRAGGGARCARKSSILLGSIVQLCIHLLTISRHCGLCVPHRHAAYFLLVCEAQSGACH